MAPIINYIAKYVPKGRERRLNVGLWGYSREVGHVSLPRAIPLTTAGYSIGIPPEFIGLVALDDERCRLCKKNICEFRKRFRRRISIS